MLTIEEQVIAGQIMAAAFRDEMEKMGSLPSYLKKMTKMRRGILHVEKWPVDRRLQDRITLAQYGAMRAGHHSPKTRPQLRWGQREREMMSRIHPGSAADMWRKSRASLRGE